jgi:hypothetical protein
MILAYKQGVLQSRARHPLLKLGSYTPIGIERQESSSHRCLHLDVMTPMSLRIYFWVVEGLYLKGTEKRFIIAGFLK